ncbi:MAG: hypothetical protein H6719_36345 [Sandaracinaceae bacterium]|nr:hypothetical protein [Sandaracinaceae bacterium]
MKSRRLHALAALGAVVAVGCAPRPAESARATHVDVPTPSRAPSPVAPEPEAPEPEAPAEPLVEEPVTEPSVEEADAEPDTPSIPAEAPVADAGTPDAGRVARPAPASCEPETWGGWDGTAQCRASSRRRVAGPHRRCETDAECVFVSEGCHPHAVHRRHAARYRRWSGPCTGPGAGACSGPGDAVCDQGCCVASLGFGRRRGPPAPLR